jgi:putative oxidoreductase
MTAHAFLFGRLFLAAFFLISAYSKAMAPGETAELMRNAGIAGAFLWPGVAIEVVGALALAVGWMSRPAAFVLAMMTLLSAMLFHTPFSDANELSHFAKDVAIAGGLLYVMVMGPGAISLSARFPTVRVQSSEPASGPVVTP